MLRRIFYRVLFRGNGLPWQVVRSVSLEMGKQGLDEPLTGSMLHTGI